MIIELSSWKIWRTHFNGHPHIYTWNTVSWLWVLALVWPPLSIILLPVDTAQDLWDYDQHQQIILIITMITIILLHITFTIIPMLLVITITTTSPTSSSPLHHQETLLQLLVVQAPQTSSLQRSSEPLDKQFNWISPSDPSHNQHHDHHHHAHHHHDLHHLNATLPDAPHHVGLLPHHHQAGLVARLNQWTINTRTLSSDNFHFHNKSFKRCKLTDWSNKFFWDIKTKLERHQIQLPLPEQVCYVRPKLLSQGRTWIKY